MTTISTSLNTGKHIGYILDLESCEKHQAPKGLPCYILVPGAGDTKNSEFLDGVCGSRIRKAGYNGKISPTSIQLGRKGRSNKR